MKMNVFECFLSFFCFVFGSFFLSFFFFFLDEIEINTNPDVYLMFNDAVMIRKGFDAC